MRTWKACGARMKLSGVHMRKHMEEHFCHIIWESYVAVKVSVNSCFMKQQSLGYIGDYN